METASLFCIQWSAKGFGVGFGVASPLSHGKWTTESVHELLGIGLNWT